MISSMRSSSVAAAGRGERRDSFFGVRWRDRGNMCTTVASRALRLARVAPRLSDTAQPGVDGCRAGLGVKAGDGDLQVRPLIRPLEIGDVRLNLLQIEPSLLVGEMLLDGSAVDVVEG